MDNLSKKTKKCVSWYKFVTKSTFAKLLKVSQFYLLKSAINC